MLQIILEAKSGLIMKRYVEFSKVADVGVIRFAGSYFRYMPQSSNAEGPCTPVFAEVTMLDLDADETVNQ